MKILAILSLSSLLRACLPLEEAPTFTPALGEPPTAPAKP